MGGWHLSTHRGSQNALTRRPRCSIAFTFEVREAGRYSVVVHFTPNANRATNVPVSLTAGTV